MPIGMWSIKDNTERLERIEKRLESPKLDSEERNDLEELKRELQAWFHAVEDRDTQ